MTDLDVIHDYVFLINQGYKPAFNDQDYTAALISLMIGDAHLADPNQHFYYLASDVIKARGAFLRFGEKMKQDGIEYECTTGTSIYSFSYWIPDRNLTFVFYDIARIATLYRGLKVGRLYFDISFGERMEREIKQAIDTIAPCGEETIGL